MSSLFLLDAVSPLPLHIHVVTPVSPGQRLGAVPQPDQALAHLCVVL